ncbi:TetR/AcrR family transcriptional regulator [Streptomyces sp. NPDC020792]|uniref:TetR/AcrR family transcriptional regulator n=1 Tax=Streptomyces sp. NPDC020792 TaxID=3365089 RepID=UPI00379AE652
MPAKAGQAKKKARASTRRPRGSLSREKIIEAAFDLIEDRGVGELSMPRLARHIGVGVTSIYWYFRSKEELFDALTERAAVMFSELMPTLTGHSWDSHLRHYFRAFRRIFMENPALCDLIILRAPMQPQEATDHYVRRLEAELNVLMAAGFPMDQAVHAYMTLSVYARGCVLQNRLYAATRGSHEDHGRSAFVSAIDPGSTPAMAASVDQWSTTFATDADFEAGLTTIVNGLTMNMT